MLEVDISQQMPSWQSIPQGSEASEQNNEPPKQVGGAPAILTPVKPHQSGSTHVQFSLCVMQRTKVGWFSGWFNSKPRDVQKESSEEGSSAQTVRVKTYIILFSCNQV